MERAVFYVFEQQKFKWDSSEKIQWIDLKLLNLKNLEN